MIFGLRGIPDLHIAESVPLARYTRFGLGGQTLALVDAPTEESLIAAIQALDGTPWTLIGGGTNLIAADEGYPGVVLRYTAKRTQFDGTEVRIEAGTVLQDVVDSTIAAGLQGFETMTGIPGWMGGAVYGNAGAYGRSIHELVHSVRYFDGHKIQEINNLACEFRYRESIFKRRKDWIILSVICKTNPNSPDDLAKTAAGILAIRNKKYPPTMLCAGSIFKNLLLDELPDAVRRHVPDTVIREGKVPSAFFLEQIGAKGMISGDICVADYHANLLYNRGLGTAVEARELIDTLKARVHDSYGLLLEEEVQYVGSGAKSGAAPKLL